MAGNKYLVPDRTTLLKTKMDLLSKKLQSAIRAGNFSTKEEYLFEATKLIGSFYKDLLEPMLELENVLPDTKPSVELYNYLWNTILDDLTVIFTELENIETLTIANFNYITTEANRLVTRIKAVSSKLGDYILYSTDVSSDALYFIDSFNDLSKIDVLSALLNSTQCAIDQEQGLATLPINLADTRTASIKQSPVINSNSNGVPGNNQELNRPYKGDINVILDNNPDTWFEYERVVSEEADTKEALVLDFVVNLGEPTIINYIRVNPNNFGTKTIIKIDDISTSRDGKLYTSIKDDIPIAGFLTEDEDNVFVLAPSTSKYAGQGIYSFTPREAKYVHFVFRQTESFPIETVRGRRVRYAIGIRDVDIKSVAYENKGELISTPYYFPKPVQKVLLETRQNPVQPSELADIEYQISPDGGLSWLEIQPKAVAAESGKLDIPEVLNFNSIDENSINTAAPVFSLLVKAVFSRNDEQFTTSSSSLNKKKITTAEVHSLPIETPFAIELEHAPIIGSLLLVDTMFGSRGIPGFPYVIGYHNRELTQIKYRLPFLSFPRPFTKVLSGGRYQTEPMPASDWLHLEVGGEEWTHVTSSFATYSGIDKVYRFNINDGTLEFGNGTNGLIPDANQLITAYLEAERLFPAAPDGAHKAQLEFTTTANKSDLTIKRYEKITDAAELLPRRASVIRLQHQNLVDITAIQDTLNSLPSTTTQVDFQNGKDELTDPSYWSIDTEVGIIYLATPTPDTTVRAIGYTYQPITTLTSDDWDWTSQDVIRDSIIIKNSAWGVISVDSEEVGYDVGSTVLELSKLSVTEGSLLFEVLVSGVETSANDNPAEYPFVKEVKFVDGRQELGNPVNMVIDRIPSLVSGLNVISFREDVHDDDTQYKVFFTRPDIFTTEIVGTPNSNGEYELNRIGNIYSIYVDSDIADPGKVTYFTSNPNYTDNGLYSVDYVRGKVYSQRTIPNTYWTIKASYTYSDYRAEYKIARIVDTNNYEIDITNRTIFLKDSEILQRSLMPHGRINGHEPFYVVNYDYIAETKENIQGLKNYFTPVLKEYMLKVITKGSLP